MNAIAMTFATALASVAAAAAIGVGLANGTAEAAGVTVIPERTMVLAQRAEVPVVTRLPRVVVEHRRTTVAEGRAQVRPS
ncbi:MAG: hypothetical protein ACK44A_01095 [Roseateles sp.]